MHKGEENPPQKRFLCFSAFVACRVPNKEDTAETQLFETSSIMDSDFIGLTFKRPMTFRVNLTSMPFVLTILAAVSTRELLYAVDN